MRKTVEDLRSITREYSSKLAQLSEDEMRERPHPDKWSRKEVIGHLIDSAQNNLRRFIVGQYDQSTYIVYEQDFWVKANYYHAMHTPDLIALWRLLNERIATVLETMPDNLRANTLNTGETHTLEWIGADYVKHLKHHLNQVFKNAFDITYP